jgi:Flp pilus assembly protein TadG
MSPRIRSYGGDQRGAAAVQFALLIPAMVLLVFAIVNMGQMAFAEVSMHWAVQQAARCSVIAEQYTTPPSGDPAVSCTTIARTQAYAAALYKPSLSSLAFTATLNSTNSANGNYCKQLVGQGNYSVRIMWVGFTVPIKATSCYPTLVTSWS